MSAQEPQPTEVVQRRAPFADNPLVGQRGTRTQQRILRGALQVFGEVGYHACRVERITAVAGCSRPSFYQYFSSKEDVFRHLATELARHLAAVTDELEPVTPDGTGRQALLAWLVAYGDLYDEYAPLFAAFSSAAGSDDEVASGAAKVEARLVGGFAAKIPESWDDGPHDVWARVLMTTVARAHRYRQLLDDPNADGTTHLGRERVDEALADLLHRALFGPIVGVNERPLVPPRKARKRIDARVVPMAVDGEPVAERKSLGPAGRATRARLLAAGADVFAELGYHDTRVDDIAAAGGVSHGTFYRYFTNKDEVFRVLAGRAGRRVVAAIEAIPAPGAMTVREWLADYATTYAAAGPIIRVWIEALMLDPVLSRITSQAVDAIRQRLVPFVAARGQGDADADAVVLLALIDLAQFLDGAERTSDPIVLDALAEVIERAFVPA